MFLSPPPLFLLHLITVFKELGRQVVPNILKNFFCGFRQTQLFLCCHVFTEKQTCDVFLVAENSSLLQLHNPIFLARAMFLKIRTDFWTLFWDIMSTNLKYCNKNMNQCFLRP